MQIPFLGGAYEGRSPDADAQEAVNLFFDHDAVGGRSALARVPGLTRRWTVPFLPATVTSDDFTNLKAFTDPYDAPDGITFTATTLPGPDDTGSQTYAWTVTGLSTTAGNRWYYDDFIVGIYQNTDILYASASGPTQITTDTTYSVSKTAGAGQKIIRLEKQMLWDQDNDGTPEAQWDIRGGSIDPAFEYLVVDGFCGMELDVDAPNDIEAGEEYRVVGTASDQISYNGTTVTAAVGPGTSFIGVAGATSWSLVAGSPRVYRLLTYYDQVYLWQAAFPTTMRKFLDVQSAVYDSDNDQTTITFRRAPLAGISDSDTLTPVRVFAEAYLDRTLPVSYRVPRDQKGGLFNVLGYRTFSYDLALYLIACCSQGDETEANAVIPHLFRMQYPLAPTGVHSGNDGLWAFSYYTHGWLRNELVTNGTAPSDETGWTDAGANWSVVSNKFKCAGGAGTLSQAIQFYQPSLFNGTTEGYEVVFTVSGRTVGTITAAVHGTSGTARSTNDTFTEIIVEDGTLVDGSLVFTPAGGFNGSLDVISVKPAAPAAPHPYHILAPDPYFRTGAMGWVLKALLFYRETFGSSATYYARAGTAAEAGIDAIADAYWISDSGHPQQDAFRGGTGLYDITDPVYTWHSAHAVAWVSMEHNLDMWWVLHMAADQGLGSGIAHASFNSTANLQARADALEAKLLADYASDGFWMDDKKRSAQGITAWRVVQVEEDAGGDKLHVQGDQTTLAADGFAVTGDDFGSANDQAWTVASSALSTTTIASGSVVDDEYYIVSDGVALYDGVKYGPSDLDEAGVDLDVNPEDAPNGGAVFAGRNSVATYATQGSANAPTVKRYETVITMDETTGVAAAHASGDNPVGYLFFTDKASALDTHSWYIPFCMAPSVDRLDRAEEAAAYLTNFAVQDAVYKDVRGYKPYLAQIPDTVFHTGESLNASGGMEPWSSIAYPTAKDTAWIEGTGGVLLAWLALGASKHEYYNDFETDFYNVYPAREIGGAGYPYVTVAEETYEMQAWDSLASTATMVIAQDPQNFWEINATWNNTGESSDGRGIRGCLVLGDFLYVVAGNDVYRVGANWATTQINTSVLDTDTGPVTLAGGTSPTYNGATVEDEVLLICDGTKNVAYVWNQTQSQWTRLTEAVHNFQGGQSAAYLDGYFVSAGVDADKIYFTFDVLDWTSLSVYDRSVRHKTGDIKRLIADHRELWVFKERSAEVFYVTGNSSEPFNRRPGGALEHGLLATHAVTAIDNSIYWLCHDGTVRRAAGLTPEIVSPPQVSYRHGLYETRSDAEMLAYVDAGRTWVYLTYPTAERSWLLEVATGVWTERRSYTLVDYLPGKALDGRFRGTCAAHFNDLTLVGDFQFGRLLAIDETAHEDDGHRIAWWRVTPALYEEGGDPFLYAVEIEFEAGQGLPAAFAAAQGRTANQLVLQLSRDGGHTYTHERWTSLGAAGDYGSLAVWRKLGRAERTVFKVSGSDPVKTVILGARAYTGSGEIARRLRVRR